MTDELKPSGFEEWWKKHREEHSSDDVEDWQGHEHCTWLAWNAAVSQREAAVAEAERERCLALVTASLDAGLPSAVRWNDLFRDEFRSLGHTLALDEMLAEARLEEAEWWSEFGCIKEFHELVMNSKDFEGNRLSACEHCQRLVSLRAAKGGK